MTRHSKRRLALLFLLPVGIARAAPEPKAPDPNFTECSVEKDCSPIGVVIRMQMGLGDSLPDHE